MKKALSMAGICGALFGTLLPASAVTIYTQNWGSPSAAVTGNGTLNLVGWTGVARTFTTQPYLGIYQANGANDPFNGLGLPVNTVYFTGLTGTNQPGPGMFYTTTESGAGSGGNSTFTAINPAIYTNLTFNVEVRNSGGNTPNFFAIRVGASWYVATNNPLTLFNGGYPTFTNWSMVYTPTASVWNDLTINSIDVTIGATAAGDLAGNITGIGIVTMHNPAIGGTPGFNFNQIVINQGPADFPSNPPQNTAPAVTPQTVYAGGGASFLTTFSGTPNLVYRWRTNGVVINNGPRVFGAQTTMLTITNVNADDAVPTYSVVVTNFFGSATNDGITLVVNPVPSDILYAETFPYVGPNGNLPIAGVGWQTALQGVSGIYSSGPGIGNVFSYSAVATTNIYYATTNDNGTSGLRFVPINPDLYPNVTLQANITPGNAAGLSTSNVVAYWTVQMQDGNWFVSASRIPVQIITVNNYQPYQMAFARAATNWNSLTINANDATIGSQATGDLAGDIIGVGIVIAHLGLDGGGDFNFNTFIVTTNAVTVQPPIIGVNGAPWSQTVPTGGGASFGVSATGAQPFTYGWYLNSSLLVDGGRISGATTPTVTIANLTPADDGPIVAYVTNSAGVDKSDNYVATTLTVTNAPIGLVYAETFPFVGPLAGNYAIAGSGWAEGVPGNPNTVYQTLGNDAAVFAFLGSAGTTVYYTSTASDLNQAGLRFPNIKIGSYPDLTISVDIAPQFNAAYVSAYLAVQINGADWYVAASALPVPAVDSPTFSTYATPFAPAAANWRNLTISGAGGLIGAAASADLSGTMTGAGLVFVTAGPGGTHNFDNLMITGTGLGGISQGPLIGNTVNLSWVGNPAVYLQSVTNLSSTNWLTVPNSTGAYSVPVLLNKPEEYFRLKAPTP